MWLILALTGYIALAVVFILDKLILTESLDKPVVYTFYSTIFMFAALLAWPFGVEMLVGIDWLWALISGLGFGFGMWAMFIAVKAGEASHVNPFIGAVITIVTFGLASVFLGESLTSMQMIGMYILAGSTFLLAFFNERGFTGFNRSYGWGIAAAVLFAISHTTAKYLYDVYPFLTGFVWTRATTGLVGVFTLFFPSVLNTFKKQSRLRTGPLPKAGKNKKAIPLSDGTPAKGGEKQNLAKRHVVGVIVVAKVLSVVGVVLIQLAIAIGSVTLVNALVGAQYALMFVLIFLLTKFAPRIFKETFSRSEIAVQTVAIVLVFVGSALFIL